MSKHIVKIIRTEPVTHNVKRFKVTRPSNYNFIPGQATDISINSPQWENEFRPFTFTGLNDWDHLEFTVKIYDDHNGVTAQLAKLKEEMNLFCMTSLVQFITTERGFLLPVAQELLPSLQFSGSWKKKTSWATTPLSFLTIPREISL